MTAKIPELKSRAIRTAISDIENLDLKIASEEEIDGILSGLIKGYKSEAPIFRERINVYRAVRCERPLSISDIGPPPTEILTSYGRGNVIGQSVFYCCNSRNAPFFELKCKPGDQIALSKWQTSPDLVLNHTGFTEETKEKLASSRSLDQIYEFVKETNNYSELNEMVHEYLGYIFSRPVDSDDEQLHYKLTSVIANKMMAGNVLHGLLYPTFQMAGNADNIILKSDYFREKLRFVNVEYININSHDGGGFSIDVQDSASKIDDEGRFEWSGRPLHWELTEKGQIAHFEVYNGQWVAKDENGEILEKV